MSEHLFSENEIQIILKNYQDKKDYRKNYYKKNTKAGCDIYFLIKFILLLIYTSEQKNWA